MPLYYQICLHSACLQCQYCQYSSAQSTANPGTLLTDYSADSSDERVNSVETAHSDRKDRALSDEAYPEERSHCASSLRKRLWRYMMETVVQPRRSSFAYEYGAGCRHARHIVWRPMYDKSFGWLFSTRDQETGRVLKSQGCCKSVSQWGTWTYSFVWAGQQFKETGFVEVASRMRYVNIFFRMSWTTV